MRISLRGLADLTNVNSMLLPDFGPNLPGPVVYEGGLTGLGQATTGQAICPSAEQLDNPGVYDPNDPCQNPTAALPLSSNPYLTSTAISSPLLPSTSTLSQGLTPAQIQQAAAAAAGGPQIAPGLSTQTMLIIGAVGIGVILLMMAAKR
jgi:hypothetical protein